MELLSKKGLYKYIIYGLGEIVLVVIGILIAVSINNQNEKRASENRLKSYLQVYHQDLVQDTIVIAAVLNNVKERKTYFKIFLSDTVSAKDYQENPQGFGLTLSFSPFKLQQKGINLLEKYIDNSEIEQDTLISKILASHRTFDNLLNETNTRIGEDISSNMEYLKENQPWIADLLLGKVDNPEMIEYYLGANYRARLAVHSTLIHGNLEPILKQQKANHLQLFEALEKRIDIK